MSIYDDPVTYAKKVRIPVSLSKIWCAEQLRLQKEMDAARVCPKCGHGTLVLEGGSYEECTSDYVYCEYDEIPAVDEEGEEYFKECDYTSDPKKEHEPLSSWYDFDVILAMSIGKDSAFEEETLQDWVRFVKSEVNNIRPKVSA